MLSNQTYNYNTPPAHISGLLQDIAIPQPNTTTSKIVNKNSIDYSLKNAIEKELNAIIKAKGYKGSRALIIKQIGYRLDKDMTSGVGQKKLAFVTGYSVKTIERSYVQYAADGLLLYEREGKWQERRPNKTTMLCLQHLLPLVTDKMSDDINNLTNLRDLNNNITYEEHVSLFNNLQKEKIQTQVPTEKPKPLGTHISQSALGGPGRNDELLRVCLAWLLTDAQTKYVITRMADKSIVNQAYYLSALCRGLKEGTWNMSTREDLGYTKTTGTGKPHQSEAPKPKVSPEKRQEIHDWAEKKAYDRAKELGKTRSDTDYEQMRNFDSFITSETLNFEKQAFLKIHMREIGK
jgi:transposase